ncbi:MAG: amino acid permease, partial [Chlamydiia bacterium]|nr:amino acid permease [Chlamydiia bacterium]
MKKLFKKKSIHSSFSDLDEGDGGHQLKRHLKANHLISIGIGAIIGAGIFVITGQAAALYAGPAVILSFCLAAFICTLTGLCYAELSSMIPIAGGSYSYSYVALGELPAWIIGWAVVGQYIIAASTVAVGWGGYCVSFLKDVAVHVPEIVAKAPIGWSSDLGWHFSGSLFNLPAIAIIVFLTVLICIGIKAAANFNNVMVVIKLCTIFLFIVIGLPFVHIENWIPFI